MPAGRICQGENWEKRGTGTVLAFLGAVLVAKLAFQAWSLDQLAAESTDDVMPWLLKIRKPHQRVLTVITGRQDGVSDPNTWKRWYEAGCDFFGYAWGTPPDFRPHASMRRNWKSQATSIGQCLNERASRSPSDSSPGRLSVRGGAVRYGSAAPHRG